MKALLLLGATSSFILAFAPVPSFAQTSPTLSSASVALTCRSALQAGKFSQVQDIASPPCCYVSIEEDWYKANGIRLASIYQRSNGDTYRAESCELISDAGLLVDQTTTGGIGSSSGAPLAGQPASSGAGVPVGNTGVQPSQGAGTVMGVAGDGQTAGGNTGSGNTDGNTGGQPGNGNGHDSGGNTGGTGGGQNGGGSGDDGNNGHGNDPNGVDSSNPGKSHGTANHGNNNGGTGNGGEHEDREKGNNGFGNGGGDGSPNGKQDEIR